MLFAFVFNVDEDIIEIYYYKNVKLFCQDLVDTALERGRCIGQSKRHHLVFKILIASLEDRLPFVFLPNSHLIVGIG